jgi:hypothetical protein
MTTLRDYLLDLIQESVSLGGNTQNKDLTPKEWADKMDALLEEYIDYIKNRLIG